LTRGLWPHLLFRRGRYPPASHLFCNPVRPTLCAADPCPRTWGRS